VASAGVDSGERDRFYVLEKSDLQKICAANYWNWMDSLNWKRPRNYKSLDNRYYIRNLEPQEDNWSLILCQLQRRRGKAQGSLVSVGFLSPIFPANVGYFVG
jgi:hypothetical protein